MKKRGLFYAAFIVLTVFGITVLQAQSNCPALVEEALSAVDLNCEGLDRNSACYGYGVVTASFVSEVPDDYFVEPADTSELRELQTISTSVLDIDENLWGVAVLDVQANLPNTIPGQSVVFVLIGDTEVENAVAPEEAFQPSEGLTVTTSSGANIRSGPGLNFNVIGGAPQGEELLADGLSEDGDWLRVAYNNRVAWINRVVLEENAAIADLPTLTPNLRTPMQSFRLRTGIGTPDCEEAPDDLLLVQGPDGFEIDLTVNGAEIRIGSTIAMRYIEVDGEILLEMIVIDGTLETLGPDGQPIVVTQGYRITAQLNEEGDVLDNFSEPEFVGTDEFTSDFCVWQDFPSSLLNYPVDLDCPGDPVPSPQPNVNNTTSNTNINQRTATRSEVPGVDCSAFDRVGPAEIRATVETLEWTEAPGATEYELVFYNYEGAVAQTFRTPNTSLTVNIGDVPTGHQMQWEVRAYKDGEYACVTYRSPVITRGADPNEPPGGYPVDDGLDFTGTWTCIDDFALEFTWSGAESGDTITARFNQYGEPTTLTIGTGSSGSYTISVMEVVGAGTLRASSGQQVSLPPLTCGTGNPLGL
jgi:hypothetical protein